MRLIGLHARLHAGKDTAFETIRQAAENDSALALRRAFADPLKISGMRALGLADEGVDNEDLIWAANAIKESGRITVTWENEFGNLYGRTITGRKLWQLYGTEAHRASDLGSSFGENFWVDNLLPHGSLLVERQPPLENIEQPAFWENFKESFAGHADLAVVTDVRFPNEARRILDLGGEVWWINAEERLGPNEDAHPSEQKLPDHYITHTIDNNGTVAQFQQNVIDALNS